MIRDVPISRTIPWDDSSGATAVTAAPAAATAPPVSDASTMTGASVERVQEAPEPPAPAPVVDAVAERLRGLRADAERRGDRATADALNAALWAHLDAFPRADVLDLDAERAKRGRQ